MTDQTAGPIATIQYPYRSFGAFRLLLALLVMLQHFCADLAPEPLMRAVAPYRIGDVAVLVFFALSGFVITEAVERASQRRPLAFLGNRFLRIVPHFLLAVGLSILAHMAFEAWDGVRLWRSQPGVPLGAFDPVNIAMNFIGIIPLADRTIDYNFLDITWAVRVEIAFYVLIALVVAVTPMRGFKRGFVWIASGLLAVLAPAFVLALLQRAPGLFAFTPCFAFGVSLYFARRGAISGWIVAAASVAGIMLYQFDQQYVPPPLYVAEPSLTGQLLLLGSLLAALTLLSFVRVEAGRTLDRYLGNLTYPLYLYHEAVFVLVATVTVGYSYAVFSGAIVLSLLTAAVMMAAVDPMIDRYRDLVRGGRVGAVRSDADATTYPRPVAAR